MISVLTRFTNSAETCDCDFCRQVKEELAEQDLFARIRSVLPPEKDPVTFGEHLTHGLLLVYLGMCLAAGWELWRWVWC